MDRGSGAERLRENSSLGEGDGEGMEDSTIRRARQEDVVWGYGAQPHVSEA